LASCCWGLKRLSEASEVYVLTATCEAIANKELGTPTTEFRGGIERYESRQILKEV
jgi:hypothetical protein